MTINVNLLDPPNCLVIVVIVTTFLVDVVSGLWAPSVAVDFLSLLNRTLFCPQN